MTVTNSCHQREKHRKTLERVQMVTGCDVKVIMDAGMLEQDSNQRRANRNCPSSAAAVEMHLNVSLVHEWSEGQQSDSEALWADCMCPRCFITRVYL